MAIIDDFRDATIPRLRDAMKVQAFFVAVGLVEDHEANSEINGLARKLGSAMLSSKEQDRLFAWIRETLWTELDKAHDRVAVIEMRMDAAIEANPSRFYEGLAARCTDPERMRLVFASISKPYRDQLSKERPRARAT